MYILIYIFYRGYLLSSRQRILRSNFFGQISDMDIFNRVLFFVHLYFNPIIQKTEIIMSYNEVLSNIVQCFNYEEFNITYYFSSTALLITSYTNN